MNKTHPISNHYVLEDLTIDCMRQKQILLILLVILFVGSSGCVNDTEQTEQKYSEPDFGEIMLDCITTYYPKAELIFGTYSQAEMSENVWLVEQAYKDKYGIRHDCSAVFKLAESNGTKRIWSLQRFIVDGRDVYNE